MAVTRIQVSWTLNFLLLAWHWMFVASLPEVGDSPEFFHAEDTIGVSLNRNIKLWTFNTKSDAKLLVTFERISLERIFDYITIGEGTIPSPDRQVLRWSGKQESDNLTYLSAGTEIWITLRKDDFVDLDGFYGKVEKVDDAFKLNCNGRLRCGNQVCLTRHDICDGFPNCVTGVDENCLAQVGVDSSFKLLSNTSVPGGLLGANHQYTWVLVTDTLSTLQLAFNLIYTERGFDFITVGEGSDPSANLLLIWSGNETETLPKVFSSTSHMWVTLTTDVNKQFNDAFSANVTSLKGPQVSCGDDMFDCGNGVCLPNKYVCDDVIHCSNGLDESVSNCAISCPLSTRCMDGRCFQGKKCNQEPDCNDWLDESGCDSVEVVEEDRGYKRSFRNHSRNIMFTTTEGRLLVSLYIPRRVTRRTKIEVLSEGNSVLSNFFDSSDSGFYNIYSGSRNMELIFSTNSDLHISANVVPSNYTTNCFDEFDCGSGLCIPATFYCDGTRHCTNGRDEDDCGVQECLREDEVECSETDVEIEIDILVTLNVTMDNAPKIAGRLFNVSTESDHLSSESVDIVAEKVEEIVNLQQQAGVGDVTESVIGIVNNMYDVDSQSIDESTSIGLLPDALERQLGNAVTNNQNFTEIMLPNVRAAAAPVNQDILNDRVSFGSSFLANTSREGPTDLVYFSPPTIRAGVSSNENLSSYIEVPSSIRNKVTTGVDFSVPLSFVIYKNASIFPAASEAVINSTKVKRVISSQIIAAGVANVDINNLPNEDRVKTKFYSFPVASRCEEEKDLQCVFWDYNKVTRKGKWSSEGCEMSSKTDDGIVTCLCDHLTSFAVLVHVTKEDRPVTIVLDIITDIGCGLSIIGLLLCVVTIFAIKKVRDKQQSHVHVNLCISLIAFYLTFMIGIDRSDNPLGCKIITSFIHFFCLSSMAWMTVEAVLLHKLIYQLQQQDIKYLLPVGMIFAWGVPLILALVVAFLDNSHDYECFPDYCFLHPGMAMYFGFLLLIVLMFIFNTVIFLLVSFKFFCRPMTGNNDAKRRKERAFRIRGIILFWLLMGMSWMFGLLAAIPSPIKILFDILFSFFMALQGFAMFYFLTVTNPEVRKLVKRFNCLGDKMSLLSRGRSTTKTTQASQKSQSNDQTAQSSSVATDTIKSSSSSSEPQTGETKQYETV